MTAFFLLLLAFAALLAGRNSGQQVFYNISYLILGLLVVSFIIARTSVRGIRVDRQPRYNKLPAGDQFEEVIAVENHSLLPKLWVTFYDRSTLPNHHFNVAVSLGPRQRRRWLIRTPTAVRGRHRIGPLEIGSGDLFGIFHSRHTIAQSYRVLVYPRMEEVPLDPFVMGPLVGKRVRRPSRLAVSQSVVSIRDYQPGDSLSKISWKATARTGRLMSKEFEPDPAGDLWLVLDLYRGAHWPVLDASLPVDDIPIVPESTEETAITATASIARKAILQGRAVGLIAVGQHLEILPPDRGVPQLQRMLEVLSTLRAVGETPLHALLLAEASRLSGEYLIMVVTPDPSDEWARLLAGNYSHRRVAAVLIDRQSFGAPFRELAAEGALAAVGVRCSVVKSGVPLAVALASGWRHLDRDVSTGAHKAYSTQS